MWWLERRAALIRPARLAAALALAALLGGCFEPLYGERSLAGGPGLRSRMAAVDVATIEAPNGSPLARIATELRNDMIFDFQGGSGGTTPTHMLRVQMSSSSQQVIVDIT